MCVNVTRCACELKLNANRTVWFTILTKFQSKLCLDQHICGINSSSIKFQIQCIFFWNADSIENTHRKMQAAIFFCMQFFLICSLVFMCRLIQWYAHKPSEWYALHCLMHAMICFFFLLEMNSSCTRWASTRCRATYQATRFTIASCFWR